ncbi:hypothetical protein BDN70DRAFT_877603 [Pholiota conissans]|uniref:Uncharacterized protein n=1 Tax=Pholiota conissans TaxID=109636 RepID=A0A9P5Z2X3_9AGAR|nr:hypothetical protein BDN70DRAFT_877603 [Pholiota conissans]
MPSTSLLTLILVVALSTLPAATIPLPLPDTDNQVNNAYSGTGGKASGGSVIHSTSTGGTGLTLLSLFSGNAGNGGDAKSGAATTGGAVNVTGDSTGTTNNVAGNAYTGAGGTANGGDVDGPNSALIEIGSNNAGNGGNASSGKATTGMLEPEISILYPDTAFSTAFSKSKPARMIRVRWDAAYMGNMD